MSRFIWLIVLVLTLVAAPRSGVALERFPRPEFESGYELPEPTTPGPRSDWLEYMDVAVLLGALVLACYFVLRTRSRRSIFLLTVFCLLYFGFWRLGCVCSIGSIQNISAALADSSFTVPLTVVAFFALPLLFAAFFGRVFCAAVCPLGAIQDLVVIKPVRVPRGLAAALGVIPYLYLGLAVLFAATGALFLICRFDPFVAFFRVSGRMYQFLLGTSLLLIGMFVARPYCRFLCPLAVPLRWLSRLSKWHASITPNECINCRLCEDSCPFDAINRPGADRQTEDSGKGVRRLAVLLVLLPVLAAGGGFAGYAMHGFLAEAHRTVRLADQLVLEKQGAVESNQEIEAFRASGSTRDELVAEASEVRESFAVGGTLVGVFAGLMFGIKLVGHSVHRKREGYEPDRAECLSCGRCFAYCPVEQSGKNLREKE